MSSLDHDRLLEERPKASRAAARPGTATEVSEPRRSSRSSQEKAEGQRPRATRTPATRTPATRTPATRTPAARTRSAAAVAKAATEKGATAKGAVAKAAPQKRAAAKAAVATSAAGKAVAARTATRRAPSTPATATPAKATSAKASPAKATPAKASAAKASPAKASPAKATPAKATAAKAASPARESAAKAAPAKAAGTRPSPVKRTASTPKPAEPAGSPAPVAVLPVEPPVEPAVASLPAQFTAAPARAALRRRLRLTSSPRRRPAVLLAAALVGALSVGLFSSGSGHAEASVNRPVSVAHVLGLTGKQSSAPSAAADQLRMVAASRAQREAEQTAAAQAQNAADQAALEAARPKAVMPVNGAVLTTCFCMRWGTMHWGIDLAAPTGTPEYAAMDGVVVKAGPASGFGQAVYIQHANGDVTVYGHMEKILVTTGQVVHAGDTIALLGAEGQATGPHLHFEVHVGGIEGQKIDPIPWLRERGVQI